MGWRDEPNAHVYTDSVAYQSLEKSLAELAGQTGTQSAEASAAQILAAVKTFMDAGLLTFGAIADGEYLKRDGATIVGGTPAGDGGAVAIYKTTVNFDDPVVAVGGFDAVEFYHLPAGCLLLGGQLIITEAFDDTNLAGGAPSIKDASNSFTLVMGDDVMLDFAQVSAFVNGIWPGNPTQLLPGSTVLADLALGADLLFNYDTTLAGDGTTGICAVYLVIGTATAI